MLGPIPGNSDITGQRQGLNLSVIEQERADGLENHHVFQRQFFSKEL